MVVSIKKSICISAQCKTSKVSERFIAKRRAENAKSYKDALLFFQVPQIHSVWKYLNFHDKVSLLQSDSLLRVQNSPLGVSHCQFFSRTYWSIVRKCNKKCWKMRLFRGFLNTVKCYFSSSRNKRLTFFLFMLRIHGEWKKEFRLNKSIFSAEKGQILARQNDSFIGLMLQQTRKHHRRQTAAQTNGNHIGGVKMRNPTRSFKNHTDILAFF